MGNSFGELIKNTKKGDDQSLIDIICKFKQTIKKFTRNLHYEEAETDLIIALIEIIKNIRLDNFKNKSDGAIVNYIYRSMENKKIDLFRKDVKGVREEVEINLDILEDEESYEYDDRLFIKSLLDTLTNIQKRVIVDKYIRGYSDNEIAIRMNILRQAVNRSKNRAIKSIRDYLEYNHLGKGDGTFGK